METTLPAVNAVLNFLSFSLIVRGLFAIKSGNKILHQKMMGTALCTSSVFLICYLSKKYLYDDRVFPDIGWIRTFYLVMLASHVLLAIGMLPLIFQTVRHAIGGNFAAHRWWARITYPIWLYVSITGVLVYFFLYQWF